MVTIHHPEHGRSTRAVPATADPRPASFLVDNAPNVHCPPASAAQRNGFVLRGGAMRRCICDSA